MRLNLKEVKRICAASMCDRDSVQYVPIQKLTIAFALFAVAQCCRGCRGKCQDCMLSTTADRLKESIEFEPFFDENFDLILPKEEEIEVNQ